MGDTASDLGLAACILAGLVLVGLLVAGSLRKVVIYYDWTDFAISIGVVALATLSMVAWSTRPFETDGFNAAWHWGATPLFGLASLACLVLDFKASLLHCRHPVLGIVVGIFKVLFALVFCWIALIQAATIFSKKSTRREMAIAFLILGILAFLVRAMVNGPEVYAGKGWPQPERG